MSLIFSKTIKNEQKSLPERCSFRKGPAWTNAPKETPGCTCPSGSMTLEAAVVVPILACLFTFVLFFFRVMQVQLCVQDALEDTGRTLSVYAAVKDSQEEKYAVLAKSMFIAKAREDDNIRKFVTGNVFGITFSESSFEGNDICLRVHYQMKFPVSLLGKSHSGSRSRQFIESGQDGKTNLASRMVTDGYILQNREPCIIRLRAVRI